MIRQRFAADRPRRKQHRAPSRNGIRLTPWLALGLLGSIANAMADNPTATLSDFHWLRPLWLLALLPVVALLAALRRHQRHQSNWQQVIDSDLLVVLSDEQRPTRQARWPLTLLALAWLLAILALAGPTWQRLPQPTFAHNEALVIILDLSASMYATDADPSRLIQARREIQDVLRLRDQQGGSTALIAYAGDAHVVTPLTEDTQTIALLLPSLNPGMMPAQGNNPLLALQQAEQLIRDAQVERARILLITDGLPTPDFDALTRFSQRTPYALSILGIGSEAGAPIPLPRGGFLTNNRGEVIIAKLNQPAIRRWAQQADVRYRHNHFSDRDVHSLLPPATHTPPLTQRASERSETFDSWQDFGPTLALVLLPLAALAFRRGWLLCLLLCSTLPAPQPAYAVSWQELWLNKNQQAQRALEDDDPERAATLFSDEQWRGVARYQAGDYAGAAEAFAQLNSSEGHYNRGNALAMQGELEAAIEAYARALELDPDNQDAADNKRQIEELLKQQQQQQQQDQNQEKQQQKQQQQQQDDQQQSGSDSGDPADSQQDDGGTDQGAQSGSDQQQQLGNNGDTGQATPRASENEQGEHQQGERANSSAQPDDNDQQQPDATANPDQAAPAPAGPEDNDSAADANDDEQLDGQDASGANEAQQGNANPELQQWLRQIPDEPGKLLQRKFDYQYRRQPQRPPDTNQEERY